MIIVSGGLLAKVGLDGHLSWSWANEATFCGQFLSPTPDRAKLCSTCTGIYEVVMVGYLGDMGVSAYRLRPTRLV